MSPLHGTVTYSADSDRWVIRCEPHVRSRLKRVFARAPQETNNIVVISNTPENTRDLEWFLQRYPMEVKDPARLSAQSQEHRDMELRIEELLQRRRPPADIALAKPPREYQVFSAELIEVRRGLLLADDVGLGKTVTAICSMVLPDNLPATVVVPAHMLLQWEEKIHEFAPALKVHRIRTGKPYPLIGKSRRRQADLWPERLPDVIIVSYHRLRTWAETLAPISRFVVFDECQQLRNPGSQISQACRHMAEKARLRLGLSATPIYNYGSEFFWVVDVLLPGCLGTREEFVREWCTARNYGDKARIADTAEFGAYLRREGIMLRRSRKDVGRELPELSRITHTIDADTDVLEKLESNAVTLAQIILASNERYAGEKMKAAGEFDMLMRQATGIAKAPYVAEFVHLLVENGEQVVLFGWHREVYSIWQERLKDLHPVMYTGSESPTQKDAALRGFRLGHSKVLIMSLRSGAGVDGLQGHCRTVVFGELDWSPGVHEQCMGRIHRDGHGDPVAAYFMLTEDGADPIMGEVLGLKREQIEGVRNPSTDLVQRIETGEGHIRALAREFLNRRGELVLEPASVESPP